MLDDLAEVRAHLEIQDALARYCRSMDRMDNELCDTLWHPGATVNYEPSLFRGSAHDFVRWVYRVHEAVDVTTHRFANIIVRVDGHTAVSEAYGHVMLVTRGEGEESTLRHAFGRYLDTWSFHDDRWAIDHREYRRDIGYSETVVVPVEGGSRDRADFSYERLGDLSTPGAS